ncbi:MAG: RDD family protein, partial [Rhodanobacter sp.]|nr:RDD family protein [Rhodanobacter sp.]
MLDTTAQVETPEGIALQLRSAGIVPRALAWAVDATIRIIAILVAAIVFALFGEGGIGFYFILAFVLLWFYPVLFEVLRDGQTPGKMAMNLRVINANGTPVTWLGSIVRNLLRTVDMLPLSYACGLVTML